MMRSNHNLLSILFLISLTLSGCIRNEPAEEPRKDESHGTASPIPSTHGSLRKIGPASLGFDYSSESARHKALGIPTPATSARYRALPDATLEAMAKAGDKTAKTFWVERLADEALTLQQSRDEDGSFPEGIEEKDAVGNIGQAAYHLGALMQDPTNAMAGYLWGLHNSSSTYGGPLEPVVAGIRLAGLRGDDRALETEREFRRTHPGLDEADIEMYFESGKRQMESAAKRRGP